MTDKFVWTLVALFVAGLIGGTVGSADWLWLCAPLLLFLAIVAFAIWFAHRQLKGLNLWR